MKPVIVQSSALWDVSDVNQTSFLLNYLRAWAAVVAGDADTPPVYSEESLPKAVEIAWDNIFRLVKSRPTVFVKTVRQLVLSRRYSCIYYNSVLVDISMLSELLRLFLILEPKETEWRLAYLRQDFDDELIPSVLAITATDRSFADVRDLCSFYKGTYTLNANFN